MHYTMICDQERRLSNLITLPSELKILEHVSYFRITEKGSLYSIAHGIDFIEFLWGAGNSQSYPFFIEERINRLTSVMPVSQFYAENLECPRNFEREFNLYKGAFYVRYVANYVDIFRLAGNEFVKENLLYLPSISHCVTSMIKDHDLKGIALPELKKIYDLYREHALKQLMQSEVTLDFSILTEDEINLLYALLGGFSTKDIASIRGRSLKTVYNRLETIKEKMGINKLPFILADIAQSRYHTTDHKLEQSQESSVGKENIILQYARGLSTKEVALEYHLSHRTVEAKVQQFCRQYNVKDKSTIASCYDVLLFLMSSE